MRDWKPTGAELLPGEGDIHRYARMSVQALLRYWYRVEQALPAPRKPPSGVAVGGGIASRWSRPDDCPAFPLQLPLSPSGQGFDQCGGLTAHVAHSAILGPLGTYG